ncbi:MAG: metallophosphoesterase family protein [Chloroflexi bacterium]|nr:metallophosphoesterase family protein [Chloroflexota bacterium]
MKIAVISDIHGNIPALQATVADIERWQPDTVVVNGDIVNRGPCSLAVLEFVQSMQETNNWHLLRGNHEEFVAGCAAPNLPQSGPEFELIRFAHWSYQQLNGKVASLQTLPDQFSWHAPDGAEIRVTHASMESNRDGIYPDMDVDELRRKIAPAPAVFVSGHTHRPLIQQLDQTMIVNVGAVGSSFDADRRASYGQFTWTKKKGWCCKIVRVAYDFACIERDYVQSGFLEEGGPLAQLMLVELRRAGGLVYRWASRYQEAMLAGEISMESSVRALLLDEDLRPFVVAPGWTL